MLPREVDIVFDWTGLPGSEAYSALDFTWYINIS